MTVVEHCDLNTALHCRRAWFNIIQGSPQPPLSSSTYILASIHGQPTSSQAEVDKDMRRASSLCVKSLTLSLRLGTTSHFDISAAQTFEPPTYCRFMKHSPYFTMMDCQSFGGSPSLGNATLEVPSPALHSHITQLFPSFPSSSILFIWISHSAPSLLHLCRTGYLVAVESECVLKTESGSLTTSRPSQCLREIRTRTQSPSRAIA